MRYLIIPILCLLSMPFVFSQEAEKIDSVNYKKLLKRIEQLEKQADMQNTENELKLLMDEAGQLSEREKKEEVDISKKFHSGIRQQQGLNPNLSVLGDFFTSISNVDDEIINEPGDRNHGNNGLFMRSLELSFVAPLDPFARGKAFLDITDDGVAIEEAYMELINLPLSMSVKMGVFFPEFGLLNRHHTHALAQFDRPKTSVNYFGLDGFNGMGTAFSFMLPKLLFSDASSLDLSVLNIHDNFSYSSDRSVNLAYVGHLKNYYDISEASYFEYVLSAVAGNNDDITRNKTYIGSLGLHYKWQAPGTAKYKSFDWKTEFFYGFNETPAGIVRSKGFYSLFHRKLDSRFWLGGRIGYSEMPYDNTQSEWDYTVNLDFWQTEFVFYRIQYQYNSRDIAYMPEYAGSFPSSHTLVFQFSWAMGPHKHEAY